MFATKLISVKVCAYVCATKLFLSGQLCHFMRYSKLLGTNIYLNAVMSQEPIQFLKCQGNKQTLHNTFERPVEDHRCMDVINLKPLTKDEVLTFFELDSVLLMQWLQIKSCW